jgi:hypothetical protein
VVAVTAARARQVDRWPIAAGLAVFLTGFGALCLFSLAHSWPTPRGLFFFRSATIGDGLLLPLITALLVRVITRMSSVTVCRERLVASIAFAVGFGAGAATQALWLADDRPVTNWTLPAAHTFDAPGWWHAVFLSTMCGTVMALAVMAARRIAAARAIASGSAELPYSADRLAGSLGLDVLFGAGLLFAGLVAIDNAHTTKTQAGMATAVALAIAATVTLGAIGWVLGRHAIKAAAGLAATTAAVAGACALIATGLRTTPAVGAIAVVCVILIAIALVAPIRPVRTAALARGAVIVPVLLGGASLSFDLVAKDAREAFHFVVASSLIAVVVAGARRRNPTEMLLATGGIVYILGVLSIVTMLEVRRHSPSLVIGLVVGVIGFLTLGVFAIVQGAFNRFMTAVQGERKEEAEDTYRGTQAGRGTWLLLAGIVIPTILVLSAFAATAGPRLGIDRGTRNSFPGWLPWMALLCAVTAAGGVALGFRYRAPTDPFVPGRKVQIHPTPAALLYAALLLWALTITQAFHGPLHYPFAAAVASLALAGLASEDIVRSSVRLQLAVPSRWGVLGLAAGTAVAVAIAVFWLLANGLWVGAKPVSILPALIVSGVILSTSMALMAACGACIALALPTEHITEQPPTDIAIEDSLMYAALGLFVAAVPVFIMGRLHVGHPKDIALPIFEYAGFLIPLYQLILWALKNNHDHAQFEAKITSRKVRKYAARCSKSADPSEREAVEKAVNGARVSALQTHIDFTNRVTMALLVFVVAWIGLAIG